MAEKFNFNVNSFKSALANGGVRPNQFVVQIGWPTAVLAAVSDLINRTPLLINIAELPGQVVNPAIVLYRGREVKFAGDRIYAPWATTVLNDTQFTVRRGIELWMNLMEGYLTKDGQTNPGVYQQAIEVHQLDRNGSKLRSYALQGAFPVDLSPVALDFGANDQISTFTCTWQYQSFVPIDDRGTSDLAIGQVFNSLLG